MSGHLSLKWNNHSSSLLRSLTKVQSKEQYCDATIACQGKYFPVHRIILSTCSEYFEEIFERIQNQHPYIIFKDIEPREMELLLNYMYQGEVNVLQENLPMLIKAAEALKIKGLAVPDDVPAKEQPLSKKRSSSSNDYPYAKRRTEEKRKRRESNEEHSSNENDGSFSSESYSKHLTKTDLPEELKVIKEEPVDTGYEESDLSKNFEIPLTERKITDSSNEIQGFSSLENATYIKDGSIVPNEPFENQSSSWATYAEGEQVGNLPVQDDIYPSNASELASESYCHSLPRSLLDKIPNAHSYLPQGNVSTISTFAASPLDHLSISMKNDVKSKRFACTMCSYRFSLRSDLERHILVHTGEKPFSCPRCSKKFRQESHLRRHLAKKILCVA